MIHVQRQIHMLEDLKLPKKAYKVERMYNE
jgi:hypothetical protein